MNADDRPVGHDPRSSQPGTPPPHPATTYASPTPASPPPTSPPASADRSTRRNSRQRRAPGIVTATIAASVAAATSLGMVAVTGSLSDAAAVETDVGGEATPIQPTVTSGTEASGDAMTVSEVAAAAAPSVAAVEVRVAPAAGRPGGAGKGSAVIIDSDGLLVTNNHVVADATEVSVVLADGESYAAEVLGTDPLTDLAVLEIDATDLPAAELASELPEIGTTAVAIGSPFGLDGSVSSGIVSAVDRTLNGRAVNLSGLIQTDAAINPGNSGGALLDDQARVIGINTAILSGSGASDGVGFAVPSTVVTDIAEQLATTGSVQRATLGVRGQDVDPQVAAAYGLEVDGGALIADVEPESPAARAGLQKGDIVTGVDETDVGSMTELASAIRSHDPGDTVEIEFVRDGVTERVTVQLG